MTEPVGYEAAFRAAPQALLVTDGAGVVTLVSAEAERLLRRDAADLVGQRLDRLLVGDPTRGLRTGPAADRAGGAAADGAGGAAAPAGSPSGPVLATSALRLPDGRQVPVDLRMTTPETAGAPDDRPNGGRPVIVAIDVHGEPGRSRVALEARLRRLADAEQEQERLLADLIRTQERERARIAAGVHDDSLQVITASMLRLQQLRRRLQGDPGALEVLSRLEESLALAADRLRRLIFDFRPPALERVGLPAAVRDALSRLHDDTGIEVRLDNRLTAEPPLPARVLLYRIIQEALANVGRHAHAQRVEVMLDHRNGGYAARVSDDGVGLPAGDRRPRAPAPGHLGLVLMRERATFAGGSFRLDSAPGAGTTVSVWIPRGADLETMARPPALRGSRPSDGAVA
ncbi:PAS domain-containing protein [Planosporangium thailandense]|uniref:PAS domain-containing protein n=1 Tax=Planosporangium thailandense TaxID=765197 RepID=A0ABX0XYP1_9ACTN|nr:ATP-binding protein [Planosporangium thailandense]NJC70495.1 PAS domain-containing protein [Planosporangium thailandense]